jgi:hypothetical protein
MAQTISIASLRDQVVLAFQHTNKAIAVWDTLVPSRKTATGRRLNRLRLYLDELKLLLPATSRASLTAVARVLTNLQSSSTYEKCWRGRRGKAKSDQMYSDAELCGEWHGFCRAYDVVYLCRHQLADEALAMATTSTH